MLRRFAVTFLPPVATATCTSLFSPPRLAPVPPHAPRYYTRAEIASDLNVLFATYEHAHPDLYASARARAAFIASLLDSAERDDSLLGFRRIAALLGVVSSTAAILPSVKLCWHTSSSPYRGSAAKEMHASDEYKTFIHTGGAALSRTFLRRATFARAVTPRIAGPCVPTSRSGERPMTFDSAGIRTSNVRAGVRSFIRTAVIHEISNRRA